MRARRVFLIWINPLFHDSMRLLLKHPDLVWVGATADLSAAHNEIIRLRPDTILFEKMGTGIPADLMEIIVANSDEMRVFGLSLDDNEISLYHRERQKVLDIGDLLQLILG